MAPRNYNRYMVVVGAGRNRKFVRLTDSERCAHVLGVLSLAAQSPLRGYLLIGDDEVTAHEVANEAGGGVTVKVAQSALAKLKDVGVLERDDNIGAWFVHDWWEINPEPKKDPKTPAQRQAEYRARRAARNGSRTARVTAERDASNGGA